MEKLIYLLWKPDEQSMEQWDANWRQSLVTALRGAGASNLRINLADDDVSRASNMLLATCPPSPDAMLSFWLDSASRRRPAERVLKQRCQRLAGYSVCESEPLRCQPPGSPIPTGERCPGMNHIVFLQIPERLQRKEWLDLWLERHTAVAIETQQTFGYRQNIVVRTLTENAQPFDAIVEENFPTEAMTDQNAFYRRDTPELLAENQQRMFQSCKRFIDFQRMDRLPTSQFEYD